MHEQKSAPRFSTTVMKTENNVLHYLISLPNFPQRSISEFDLIYVNFSSWIWGSKLTKPFLTTQHFKHISSELGCFLKGHSCSVCLCVSGCYSASENSCIMSSVAQEEFSNAGENDLDDALRVILACAWRLLNLHHKLALCSFRGTP